MTSRRRPERKTRLHHTERVQWSGRLAPGIVKRIRVRAALDGVTQEQIVEDAVRAVVKLPIETGDD